MHPQLLQLSPRSHEQAFSKQLEHFDLFNALITPLVMAFYARMFSFEMMNVCYSLLLFVKGYQLTLMLLPAARRTDAHAKCRYPIILFERLLRQLVVVALRGRGARFRDWVVSSTAANPPAFVAAKMLLLMSGLSVTCSCTLCLPLDFLSQVVVNTLFLCIHLPPTLAQVAYATRLLVRAWPQLVACQWLLEFACSSLAKGPIAALAGLARVLVASVSGHLTSSSRAGAGTPGVHSTRQLVQQLTGGVSSAAVVAVAVPPTRAPDFDSTAGRLVLALSAFWMFFVVWFGPLYLSWRIERSLKSRYVANCMRPQQQQCGPTGGAPSCGAATGSSAHSSGGSSSSTKHAGCAMSAPTHGAPTVVFPVLPRLPSTLLKHLGVASAACFVAAELFVLLCTCSPAVAGLLWRQVV